MNWSWCPSRLPNVEEWYKKEINPRGTIPALKLPSGGIVHESTNIAMVLEESLRGRGSQLLPDDPLRRASIRVFCGEADTMIASFAALLRAREAHLEDRRKTCRDNIRFVEGLIAEQHRTAGSIGPYFLGSDFSIADLHLVPFLDRFRYSLHEFHGFDVFKEAPLLKAMLSASLQRASVQNSRLNRETYLMVYSRYVRVKKSKM